MLDTTQQEQEQPYTTPFAGEKNSNLNSSSEVEVERIPVDNTPFYIVGNQEKGYFLAIGKNKLSDIHKTIDDVIKWINENTYTLVFNLINALIYVNQRMAVNEIDKAIEKEISEANLKQQVWNNQ